MMKPNYPRTFTITTQPYLDTCAYNQCYKNILLINVVPEGPLKALVRRIQLPRLSPFQAPGGCQDLYKQCGLALTNMMNNSEVKLTNNRIVCSATYFGNNQPNIVYMK